MAGVDEAALGVVVDVEAAVAGDVDEECEEAAISGHVLNIYLRCGRKAEVRKRGPTFGHQKHRVRDSKYCAPED